MSVSKGLFAVSVNPVRAARGDGVRTKLRQHGVSFAQMKAPREIC